MNKNERNAGAADPKWCEIFFSIKNWPMSAGNGLWQDESNNLKNLSRDLFPLVKRWDQSFD